MTDHHITMPECPACQGHHTAIARWTLDAKVGDPGTQLDWYCFRCGKDGIATVSYGNPEEHITWKRTSHPRTRLG